MIHEKSIFSQVLFFDSQLSFKKFYPREKAHLSFIEGCAFDNNFYRLDQVRFIKSSMIG